MLVGSGSLRCVSGWRIRATVLVDSVGVTSSPAPGATTARSVSAPGRPACLGERLGEPVARGDGVHGQQFVGGRERRGHADLGHRGPPAGRDRAPAVVSRERGTATQRSANSGQYSGA